MYHHNDGSNGLPNYNRFITAKTDAGEASTIYDAASINLDASHLGGHHLDSEQLYTSMSVGHVPLYSELQAEYSHTSTSGTGTTSPLPPALSPEILAAAFGPPFDGEQRGGDLGLGMRTQPSVAYGLPGGPHGHFYPNDCATTVSYMDLDTLNSRPQTSSELDLQCYDDYSSEKGAGTTESLLTGSRHTSHSPTPSPRNSIVYSNSSSSSMSQLSVSRGQSRGGTSRRGRKSRANSNASSKSPDRVPDAEGLGGTSTPARKQRSRKPFEPERRLEVRRMRQTGACFRCRWLKKPCGVGTPCPQCANVRGRVWTYPCIRVNMTDLTGLSDIGLQAEQRNYLNMHLRSWAGTETVLTVTHGFTSPSQHGSSNCLRLSVEEVVLGDSRALKVRWPTENVLSNGTIWRWFDEAVELGINDMTTKPYGIRKFDLSEPELDAYLDCDRSLAYGIGGGGCMAEGFHGLEFTKRLLKAAWQYSEITGVSIIKKALRIMTVTYLQDYVLQEESVSSNPLLPGTQKQIAPALVQLQLELLLDGRRAELEKELLSELQRTVFSRKRETWLAIFFTIYILLTTVEKTLWNVQAWKSKGWGSASEMGYERAQEISDVLVAVWRAINQGSRPLRIKADAEDLESVVGGEYGSGARTVFREVWGLVERNAPFLERRRDITFDFADPFSLEGKFSSVLVLEDVPSAESVRMN